MRPISPLSPNTSNQPAASKKASPKFGCRLFAYLAARPHIAQDLFIRQCLLTGGNSLKRQNQLDFGTQGDLDRIAKAEYENFRGNVRKAGWGLAISAQTNGDSPFLTVHKEPLPTWQADSKYDQLAEEVAQKKPSLLLGHLREAWAQRVPTPENTHPFRIKDSDWVLMQHGDVPQQTLWGLQRKLDASREAMPIGDTDTEKIACLLANQLQAQNNGSFKVGGLPTQDLREIFRDVMSQVITWTKGRHKHTAPGNYPVLLNTVLSDGKRILVASYGQPLYLGRYRTPDDHIAYLLATDKMQPTRQSGLPRIEWNPVLHNKILTLEPTESANGDKKINVQDFPLVRLSCPPIKDD